MSVTSFLGQILIKLDENLYVDQKYFTENNFRKISLKHIIEISSARINEIVNIIFNHNKSLNNFINKEINLYLNFEDKKTYKINLKIFLKKVLKKTNLKFDNQIDEDFFESIKISAELLSKGWTKEAIPIVNKKRSWISRIFSGLFE